MSEARVVVVGGGIAGASTAFALARTGAQVTVVDADHEGKATAAGAGIIQPWSSSIDGPVYDLYAAGAAHYPILLDQLADCGVTDVGYRVGGSLVVDPDPTKLDVVESRVRSRIVGVRVAGAVERLDERAARALFPPLAPGLAAVHVTGGARVDGRRLCAGLLEGARRHGATFVPAESRLRFDGDGRPRVDAGGVSLEADAVLVCAGAWSNALLSVVGLELPLSPQRGQIAHLLLPGADTSRWPSVLPLASHYLVAFDDGRVAVGATRETGSGFDARVTADGVRAVLTDGLRVAPGLADATLLEVRVGLRPLTDLQAPFVGAVPGHPGLYVNAGFGAAGLTMAPAAAAALAAAVLGGSCDVDLRPFAVPEHSVATARP